MKRWGYIFASVSFLLIIAVGLSLYKYSRAPIAEGPTPAQEECASLGTTEDCKPISLATSTWKVFENTKYGYAISYPLESSISTNNDYANDLREEEEINFYIPGRFSLVGVDASIYPHSPPPVSELNDLDLKSYAEAIRMLQVNFPNPNHKDRNIGELSETTIDGGKAYQFTLDQGFTTENKSGRGYSIPPDQTYMYTITENPKGQKIIIYYLLGDPIAETMYRTFIFK